MPGTIVWGSGGTTYDLQLSGQGRSLTNGSIIQLSGQLNNDGASGGPHFFALAELVCAASGFGAAVQALATIDLFLVPSRDGTNFATASTSGVSPNHYKGSFAPEVSGNVTRWRMVIDGIPLLPVPYRAWIRNNTGQTLSSGYTVTANAYSEYYN